MDSKTPQEVMRIISADLRLKGYTHEIAAQKLGYKSKQSISNIFSQKKYLSGRQAFKFHEAFGYNAKFLMTGEGSLMEDDMLLHESNRENSTTHEFQTPQPLLSEFWLLQSYFRRVIQAWGNEDALKILSCYQSFDSCKDARSLIILMSQVEESLQKLEMEKQNKQ